MFVARGEAHGNAADGSGFADFKLSAIFLSGDWNECCHKCRRGRNIVVGVMAVVAFDFKMVEHRAESVASASGKEQAGEPEGVDAVETVDLQLGERCASTYVFLNYAYVEVDVMPGHYAAVKIRCYACESLFGRKFLG